MAASEKQVRIAARLYEIRDAMRRLFGERYAEQLKPFQQMLERLKEQSGLDTLAAATYIAKQLDAGDPAIMMLMAAAVEIVEPSPVRTE